MRVYYMYTTHILYVYSENLMYYNILLLRYVTIVIFHIGFSLLRDVVFGIKAKLI